jgi:ABC-2 type transport system permease protein
MNWHVILAIVRKDMVDAVKNRYILFSLVMPIAVSLLLNPFFSDVNDDVGTLTVAVHDAGSSRLVSALQESPHCKLISVGSVEDLQAAVEEEALGGLVLPVGFDAAVATGEQPELIVYINDRQGGGERVSFQRLVERQLWALAGHELPARVNFVDVALASGGQSRPEFDLERYLLVLLLVMALSVTGAFVVPLLLVEEKEKHTLEALLVSPASPAEVIAGKALTGLIYSLIIAGVLVVINRGWEGDWPVTVLAILLGALFTVAVGLLMGVFFRTTMQVNTWASFLMLALMIPSWFTAWEVSMPLESAFRLLPTHYLTKALDLSLAGEASLGRVGGHLAVLAGGAAVVLAAVVWTLRQEER